MHFLKKFEPKLNPVLILKTAGIILLLLVAVSLVISSFSTARQSSVGVPSAGIAQRDSSYELMNPISSYSSSKGGSGGSVPLSPISPPGGGYVSGDDAEDFEATEYSARFKTRNIPHVCSAVFDLKRQVYVVFESAHEYDQGCTYAFKVERAHVGEVIALLKGMDPEDFSENTYTIKRLLEDVASRIEILRRKQDAVEETLEDALASYDAIIAVASHVENADALARLIEGKVRIIERLTQERIQVSAQLEQAMRNEADQRDRLAYAHFNVQATEDKFIDKEAIRNSWNAAIKKFVRDANYILQGASVRFITFLLVVGQWALYAFVLLFAAKFGWRIVKSVWSGKKNRFWK